MTFNPWTLLAGFIFGVAGIYFLKLGKKDGNLRVLMLGVALIFYPYFVENPYLCWAIGAALSIFAYKQIDG